jgi:hypothetical protein
MSSWPRDEKDEKQEKEEEKHEKEEKSWDEKWRRDPLSGIVWALILIWAGVVLLANNLGWLGALTETLAPTLRPELDTWSLILLGAGGIILLEVVIRVLVPAYRQPVTGSLIFAVILIAIGLGDLFSWQLVWPIVLIIIGISVLLGGLSRGRGPRE